MIIENYQSPFFLKLIFIIILICYFHNRRYYISILKSEYAFNVSHYQLLLRFYSLLKACYFIILLFFYFSYQRVLSNFQTKSLNLNNKKESRKQSLCFQT